MGASKSRHIEPIIEINNNANQFIPVLEWSQRSTMIKPIIKKDNNAFDF